MDVNTDGVVDSVVNLAAAVDDLPVFCEPVDSSYFDEFNLKTVLVARQQEQTFHVASNDKSRDEPSTISNIKNIEKVLNFEEDVADFSLVEKLSDSLSGLKLEENVEEPSIDDSSEKSIVPAKISAKGVTTWAVTTQIPAAEFEKLRPNLALEYPFELDVFQKQAVMRLERRENVFVAAHTSAGKTVVAEYAIALSLKNNTRSIYTSPIKALSNQKYRDFREKFGVENVGIITGDVSVNPNAPCLIMTTEIFRSMLYKGADTIRDIEFVVFDEVHYVNDAERGVVWEEVIIMLPEHVCLIFLSATTPNALEFSEWIGRTKHRKVYVTSTNKRPVPLQHFLLHDLEMYKMMHAETGYNPAALAAATKHSRDKDKPKPMTAENAKFAAQRQGEKTANAARNAGVSVKQLQAGRGGGRGGGGGGGRGGPAGRGGTGGGGNRGPGGKGGDVSGGKAQWNSLLKILQAGGREAAGGMGAINFGVATASTVLSAKARSEKNAMDKYERLPLEMRQAMSKKEYEATHVRADDDDEDVGDGSVGLLPVVVFSFSKKKCEEIADFLKGQDLLTNREKGKVKMLLNEVFGRLSPADAELPQVLRLKDMLCRGIGVHHGGLLPILKETVEILFAESIVKVLFATETFAMGVNMPARSVVFNGFSKHDGKSRRDLLPGEYTQMAGRAGRRGLDEVGTVILCAWTNLPEEQQLKKLLTGTATRLSSQFRMRYNMILNLVRVNDLTVEDMMKRSFTEYHTQKALASHDLTAKLRKYEGLVSFLENQQAEDTGNEFAGEVEQYLDLFSSCQELLHAQLRNISDKCRPATVSTLLGPGRLVHLHCERVGAPSLGMVLAVKSGAADVSAVSSTSTSKVNGETPSALQLARAGLTQKHNEKFGDGNGSEVSGGSLDSGDLDLHVWVLVPLRSDRVPSALVSREPLASDLLDMGGVFSEVYGVTAQEEGALEQVYVVTRVPVKQLASLLSVTLRIGTAASEAVGSSSARTISVHSFCRLINDVGDNYDLLCSTSSYVDLVRESRLNDLDFCDRQSRLLNQLKRLPPFALSIPQVADRYLLAFKVQRARRKMDFIRHYISDKNMTLFPDFQQRIKVLSLLGYVDKDCKVITPKGRAACELNSCDELLGTEILFNNVLEPLNPPEAAAMLAALVFQEKNDVEDALTTRMETAKAAMTDILQQLVVLQEMEGVVLDPDSKPILNFGLSAVVYQWARGMSFKEITDLTMVQEGTIVRAITRLDELCRDFRNAAVVIGNPSLYRKMEAASLCIKRDIVFAGSLYIS